MLAVVNTGSCGGPQNKRGHPAHRYRQLMQVPVFSDRGIQIGSRTCVIVCLLSGFAFQNCGYNLSCGFRRKRILVK